jgi:hypothetical protein
MKIAQQIVGVNQRLGNTAVPNMQGTTRYIYDSQDTVSATNQTLTYFQGVAGRTFPLANISSNRFEVGESLAITGITYAFRAASITDLATNLETSPVSGTNQITNTFLFNLYIGNQRVIKDLDLQYSKFLLGESKGTSVLNNVLHLETPIVIPPQIEFYATIRITSNTNVNVRRMYLGLFGQGTLLNTKSNF